MNNELKKEEIVATFNRLKKAVLGVILISFLLNGVRVSVKQVPVNSVGVKYSNIRGTISETPLMSGLHFKLPFIDEITRVSTELRSADINDMQITTKDAQAVTIDIELQYRILPEDAVETFKQFRSTPEDEWISTFVYQQIQRGVQNAASGYTVIELMGEQRGAFQLEVDKAVAEAMTNNHLSVHTVAVDDLQVSEAIKNSIEANAKAKQDVETARQVAAKEEVANETKIAKATAEASVKTIRAQAEADANTKLANSISPNLVNYLEAQARETHGWYLYNNMTPTVVTPQE